METWKDVIGYEGLYQVSSYGSVKSISRVITNSRGQANKYPEKSRKLIPQKSGHLQVSLWRNSKSKLASVHRIVAEAFLGECPVGLQVCHNDGDPTNNRVCNLRYGSSKENAQDRISHGKNWVPRGSSSGMSVLVESDIPKIFHFRNEGLSHRDIAKKFNVTHGVIGKVLRKQAWKHVEV